MIFLGLLKNEHWGHFLAESISRLWAISKIKDFDQVVFYLRGGGRKVPAFIEEAFQWMMPDKRVILIDEPTRFEMLAVPDQAIHPQIGFVAGHELVRDFFSSLPKARSCLKNVYISRSRLKSNEGQIVGEVYIERELSRQGFHIIHPQELSLSEQVAIYASAEKLIFADGSPLHLYALVCSAEQQVFVIHRRMPGIVFDWQVSSFGGPALEGDPCIKHVYAPKGRVNKMLNAKAVIDFCDLGHQLSARGFIDYAAWRNPSEEELRAALNVALGESSDGFDVLRIE